MKKQIRYCFGIQFLCLYLIIFSIGLIISYFNLSENKRHETTSHQRLPQQVVDVLNCAKELNIPLFIIDPETLIDVLSPEQRQVLENQNMMPNIYKRDQSDKVIVVYPLGVMAKDLDAVMNQLKNHLMISGFTYQIHSDFNRTKGWVDIATAPPNTITKTPVHLVFTRDNCVIQIVVFYTLDHHLWIGQLQNTIKGPTSFGLFQQIFDQFSLVEANFNDINVRVPNETDHFLSQIDTSKFVECDHRTAKWWVDTYKNRLDAQNKSMANNDEVNRKIESGLVRMKLMMKRLKIPFWMASGTLLGWYRHCAGISYTTDADFATWSRYASYNLTDYLAKNRKNTELFLRLVYGFPEMGYEYRFVNLAPNYFFTFDLFFFYEEDGRLFTTAHYWPTRAYIKYYYPKFTLCSGQLLGHKVLVPCNPLEMILVEYGTDWQHPRESYGLMAQPNHSPWFYWPKELANKSSIDLPYI